MIGKPCTRKGSARFDEGELEIEPSGHYASSLLYCYAHFYGDILDVTFGKYCALRTSMKWKAGMSSFLIPKRSGALYFSFIRQVSHKAERILAHRWCFISWRYLDFIMQEVWPNFIRDSAEER